MDPIKVVIADDDEGMRLIERRMIARVEGFTLAGEAKVKISVKGIEGSLTSSQLTFHFTGNGTFKSVAYAKALTQPVKSTSSSQPFFILSPICIHIYNELNIGLALYCVIEIVNVELSD